MRISFRSLAALPSLILFMVFLAGCQSSTDGSKAAAEPTPAGGKNSFGEEGEKAKLCDGLRAKMNAATQDEKGSIAAELEKNGCGY